MTQLATLPVPLSAYGHALLAEDAVTATAPEIRQAIARWVGEDRPEIADALLAAGLSLYPDSEDILVMGVLLSEMRQEWVQAQMHIERLMAVQRGLATAETWQHLIRVLRCQEAFHAAFRTAIQALGLFPQSAELKLAHDQLALLLDASAPHAQPITTTV